VSPDAAAPDAAIDADLAAPTDVPAVACTDSVAAVYAAGPRDQAALGDVLACAPDMQLTAADVTHRIGMPASSDVATFVIAYQTRNGAGGPAVSTARVYLPHVPRARPVPLVVAGHGTEGVADNCAPSTGLDGNLPLPYAGRGFAVIAPDFAGLGNAGTQEYLDNHAQGWQLLDGSRALRQILAPHLAADTLVLAGYSQGGGAALSAESLAHADGISITATVAYAPEWPIRLQSFDYVTILTQPSLLTISEGLSFSSVAVLRQYAYFENHVGSGQGGDAFPAAARGLLVGAINSQCLVPLGGFIQTTMLHTGDLIDPTLRDGIVSCLQASGCSGVAGDYYTWMLNGQLTPDPGNGPVLIVQGLLDQIMPPAHEAACVRDKLVSAGVHVDACTFPASTHTNIMDQHASGVTWTESVLAGEVPAACASSDLPACN
jgi:predicted esterase